ncbi:hypothetical protein FGG08_005748 [Glutinoglossum americanum]|uniref:Peptidase A2 domain-containing protein n=1 Tax=Glutinoglossum americanum TaxID=1670608 RepID=A0A9P8HXS7_9PEZI|nr:hypothetical protein FGG08_005748 [Glutinoglossum americanum]
MDKSHAPNFTCLHLSVTNLIWYIDDTFDLSGTPLWVQSLWAEIRSLRLLAEGAVRQGVDFNCLNKSVDVDSALQLLSVTDSAVRGLERDLRKLQGDLLRPAKIPAVDEEICGRYHSLLRSSRLQLAGAIDQLQNENVRCVMSSLQDPAVLGHVGHAFLHHNNTKLCGVEYGSSPPKDRLPVLPTPHPGRGKWMATTLGLSAGQGYQAQCSASCNYCRLRNTGRTRIIVLHANLLKRAIELTILLRGFKPKAQPRVYPIISESSDLVRYANLGDFHALKNLIITKQATGFEATEDNWTLLHNAAFQGHWEIIDFLLALGVDKDVTEIKLRKPSHFAKFRALRKGATEQEKYISRRLDDQDFRFDFELSPIHSAVLREYDAFDLEKPSLNTLIDFGKELSKVSCKEDWTSWRLDYRDRSPLFQEMISYFETAVDGGETGEDAFYRMLDQPDALQRWTPLQWAAFVDRKNEFITLMKHGADPFKITPSGRNLLHQAAESGTTDVIEYLLSERYHEAGLDINLHDIWGETPLYIAVAKTPALVSLLLQCGAAPDEVQGEGFVPLHYVGEPNRLKTVEILLSHIDCPINARNKAGRTPIMQMLDSIPCVELLLDNGADISIYDDNDRSIMHHACIEDRPEIIVMLLNKSPETAQKLAMHCDMEGDTPLFISLRYNRVQCSIALLAKAPVSMVADKNGWSLLHHAAKMGHEQVWELARSVPNASIFARTNSGETVYEIAREWGHLDGLIGEDLKCAISPDGESFQQ